MKINVKDYGATNTYTVESDSDQYKDLLKRGYLMDSGTLQGPQGGRNAAGTLYGGEAKDTPRTFAVTENQPTNNNPKGTSTSNGVMFDNQGKQVSPGSTPPSSTNTPSDATTTTEAAKPETYTIKSGDTLSALATKNGTNIQAIMAANPDIKNPNLIYAGKSLNLPGTPKGTPATGDANKIQNDMHAAISKVPDQGDKAAVAAAAASVAPKGSELPPAASTAVDGLIGTLVPQIQSLLDPKTYGPTLTDDYTKISKDLGIEPLQTELMDLNNVINGTEDDIRAEVTKAGGFMSESQVQALTATRNKTLIQRANSIQSLLTSKIDSLNTLIGLDEKDRSMANDRVDRATGLTKTLIDLQQSIGKNASDAYGKIVTNVGYTGLAGALAGDPYSQSLAEKSLMLPQGTLSNPSALKQLETYRQQTIGLGQQRLNVSIANNGTASSGSVDDLATAMKNGQIAPSQIPGYGKNSLRAQVESAVLKDDPSFDFTKAESNFSFEKSVKTQSTLASLAYTVDTLTQLKTLSANVDRSKITFGNKAGMWLKYNGSNKDTVAFVTKVNGAVDDVAAALGGGVSTDAKLEIAKKLLDPTLSADAFNTQVDTDLTTIASRQAALQNQSGQGTGGLSIKQQVMNAGYNYDAIKKDHPDWNDEDILSSIE